MGKLDEIQRAALERYDLFHENKRLEERIQTLEQELLIRDKNIAQLQKEQERLSDIAAEAMGVVKVLFHARSQKPSPELNRAENLYHDFIAKFRRDQ